MCSTSTRVFIRASRNKSAAFRELVAIVTGVTDQEYVIRNHTSDVVILSDSISLSMITRKKFTQNKLLEIEIFLSTFSNLSVQYFPGAGQFFADALSRQFDKVYLDDQNINLSKYFAEIQPPANKKYVGCRLNSFQFRDLLLRHTYKDNIDIFSKREFFSMNSHRYMNYKDLKTPRKIPTELDFLAHIWLGLNNPNVTQSQLAQLSSQLSFFPASALKETKQSANLTGLRDKLLTLKDARVFSEILKRKYYPKSASDEEVNLSSELDRINAPADLRSKIKDLIITKQTRSSHVSRIQSTESLDSSVAQVSDIPKVREGMLTDHTHSHKLTDTTDLEGLNENKICTMFGEQSMTQIIQQFSPLI